MGDIAAVAERLRLVRRARRKFLRLWEIEQTMINPLVERVAEDLSDPAPSQPPAAARAESKVSDKHPHAPPVDEP